MNSKGKSLLMGLVLVSMTLVGCNDQKGSKSQKSQKKVDQFEVKINLGNGAEPTVEKMNVGSALTKPADPTAPEGKTFYGWKNVKNGGQIWDFEHKDLNAVMEDVELEPVFVPANQTANAFEAELCPDITERIGKDGTPGMDGETYSGGQSGTGLIGRDSYDKETRKNKYGTSGQFVREAGTGIARYATDADFTDDNVKNIIGGYVHYNYVYDNTLTWEVEAAEAAENVMLFMRLSGEYGLTEENQVFPGSGEDRVYETFDYQGYPVTVNDAPLNYGKVTIHNIIPKDLLPFQDFLVSASVSLQKGKNVIKMTVANHDTLNGTISSSAPVIDCIKLYSPTTVTFANAKLSQMDNTNV